MKKLFVLSTVATSLVGCSHTNISQLAKELSKDPAAIHMQVMTPYGSVVLDRANPGTNQITVGANGITTK